MKTFSIRAVLGRGWEVFKGHKRTLVAATFVLMVLGAFRNAFGKVRFGDQSLSHLILVAAVIIIATIIEIGWFKLMLKLEDGEPATVRELYLHSRLFVKYFLIIIILMVASVVGFVLLIVPGFYILLTYGFAPIIAVDDFLTVEESFRRSARITKGVKWKLLGFFFVMVIVNLLGIVPAFLGLFITVPVTSLAYVRVYRLLSLATEESPITA